MNTTAETGWPSWAREGNHVVCKLRPRDDVRDQLAREGVRYPQLREVYTIRRVCPGTVKYGPTLFLCEIVNPLMKFSHGPGEPGWTTMWFDPVKPVTQEKWRLVEANLNARSKVVSV